MKSPRSCGAFALEEDYSLMSATETAPEAPEAEAERSRHRIFRYSAYVHVGEGAEDCEHAEDGKCSEPEHFHAWCRLPNPFQVRDISEKARAAQARKLRSLRDPESDAFAVLEAELDEMKDESLRTVLVEEILDRDFIQDRDEALRAVRDIEDPNAPTGDEEGAEAPKLYDNIVQDQEEYARQVALPEDQREDDFEELTKTVEGFTRALGDEIDRLQEPKRKTLTEKSMSDLVDMVRRERIEEAGTEAYVHTFNTWQWFVCTYKPRPNNAVPNERVWKDINQFKFDSPSDVIATVQGTFRELEQELAGDRGNS